MLHSISGAMLSLDGINTPRLDEYFGLWAIEASRGMSILESAARLDLRQHVAETPSPKAAGLWYGETMTVSGPGGNTTIGVLPAVGALMKQVGSLTRGSSSVILRQDLRQMANDPAIEGILLVIDSPGGTVSGTADLANEVLAAKAKKPVYAFAEDLAASAAYWFGSQADKFFANHDTAEIGSIGTFLALYDMSGMAAREGVKALVFKTGPLKGAGFPGAEVTPAQQEYFQRIVDETQFSFAAAVGVARNLTAGQVASLATGEVFMAPTAVRHGLIDGIQSIDQTVSALLAEIQSRKGKTMSTSAKKADAAAAPAAAETTTAPAVKVTPPAASTAEPTTVEPAKLDTVAPVTTGPANESEGQRFLRVFGQQGGVWFAEGRSFEESRDLHAAAQAKRIETLEADNKQLRSMLGAFKGEKSVSASIDPKDGKPSGPEVNGRIAETHGKNVARVAAGIKLPGRN